MSGIGFPVLSLLILVPLLGAVCIACIRGDDATRAENSRNVAFFAVALAALNTLFIAVVFNPASETMQFEEKYNWIFFKQSFYHLGIDGLSLVLLLLAALLFVVAVSMNARMKHRTQEFMAALLVLQGAINGVLTSIDIVMVYVFFEIMIVPMVVLIGVFGNKKNRMFAAAKMFLYSITGSLMLLMAVIFVYPDHSSIAGADFSGYTENIRRTLWLLMFIGIAVKVPLFPLHGWLPLAHTAAPNAVSIILSGLVLKVSLYLIIRLPVAAMPEMTQFFMPYVFAVAAITVVYTGLITIVQQDFKRMVAYSAIVQMALAVAGVVSCSLPGMQGAIVLMLSHGLLACGMFFAVDVMQRRGLGSNFKSLGGLYGVMPKFAFYFALLMLSAIALPGTIGFTGEVFIFVAVFEKSHVAAMFLISSLVISAVYMLNAYRCIFTGQYKGKAQPTDLTWHEQAVFIVLAILVFVCGLYPAPLVSMVGKSFPWLERMM